MGNSHREIVFVNENHAIVAWFKRGLAMNRNRRNQRQTQKVFYVMPPSDEGGGFLRSKKTEGEKTKDYPSVGGRAFDQQRRYDQRDQRP